LLAEAGDRRAAGVLRVRGDLLDQEPRLLGVGRRGPPIRFAGDGQRRHLRQTDR